MLALTIVLLALLCSVVVRASSGGHGMRQETGEAGALAFHVGVGGGLSLLLSGRLSSTVTVAAWESRGAMPVLAVVVGSMSASVTVSLALGLSFAVVLRCRWRPRLHGARGIVVSYSGGRDCMGLEE